jgi:hypothetical protein
VFQHIHGRRSSREAFYLNLEVSRGLPPIPDLDEEGCLGRRSTFERTLIAKITNRWGLLGLDHDRI